MVRTIIIQRLQGCIVSFSVFLCFDCAPKLQKCIFQLLFAHRDLCLPETMAKPAALRSRYFQSGPDGEGKGSRQNSSVGYA